ncbi:unnamed protein product, partial [Linum tenue]
DSPLPSFLFPTPFQFGFPKNHAAKNPCQRLHAATARGRAKRKEEGKKGESSVGFPSPTAAPVPDSDLIPFAFLAVTLRVRSSISEEINV